MSSKQDLKNFIARYIRENHNQEITGPVLQNVLFEIVDGMSEGTWGSIVGEISDQTDLADILSSKFGDIYTNIKTDEYWLFADKESRLLYLENPEAHPDLLLGVIAITNKPEYELTINLKSPLVNAVKLGSVNNYINYTFSIVNKDGMETGDSVTATYKITNAGTTETISEVYTAGTEVNFNIDKYLKSGANTITVTLKGQNTNVSDSLAITYNVVDLEYNPTYNISRVNAPTSTISVPYSISGPGTKYIEWYLDGVKIGQEDVISEASLEAVKDITLDAVTSGLHNLQTRAYIISAGSRFYTNVSYFDVFVRGGNHILVGVATTISDITKGALTTLPVNQYESISFSYSVYDPSARVNTLAVKLGNSTISEVSVSNNNVYTFEYTVTEAGNNTFTFAVDNSSRAVTVPVTKLENVFSEYTTQLELKLTAANRSNNELHPNQWVSGQYSTVFNNVEFGSQDGWQNGKLVLKAGESIDINYAPLATKGPKTIEITFSTANVINENETIMSLSNGVGYKITASGALLTASDGSKIETKFKSGEEHKIAAIINSATGVSDAALAFFVVDGVLDRAVNYDVYADFINPNTIHIGGTNCDVLIKSIRIYSRALTEEQELGNFAVDSDNLLTIWDRNDIYAGNTSVFDIEKLAAKIPVMIFTGNMPIINETKSKSTTVYMDIEYRNYADSKYSFVVKNVKVKPQGTSSLGYPRKNLKIDFSTVNDVLINGVSIYETLRTEGVYAVDNEVIFEWNGGNIRYSFKPNAQPVSVYTLKADYAESSGSHNTGIAKIINKALYDVRIDNKYVGRTEAQKKAIENNYKYDVRTAIDGFPEVCFYRLEAGGDLVYMGQYNFNNDKSDESVFGFRDIPGFDNSNVQCFEVLNNTHPLCLFTDVSSFDTNWADAFESRYPDTSTPNLSTLKAFSVWVNSCYNNPSKFAAEYKDHLDVDKVAVYYVYLMRFGAVDQVVKNSMITTEDGIHWFFINYDNDTVLGLKNNGYLAYPPTINRATQDSDKEEDAPYCYAGHDSVLWNNLEACEEFMTRVREIDNALYAAGLTYENVLKVLDGEQCDKWCERIYNTNGRYKYIDAYKGGVNNLFMLQGNRKSHRHWWLKSRFDLYDSIFTSGEFGSKVISFKVNDATGSFSITAGRDLNYGWGINKIPIKTDEHLEYGQSVTWTTPRQLAIGDPVYIYTAPNVMGVDLSTIARLENLDLNGCVDNQGNTSLKRLILGPATGTDSNNRLQTSGFSGLEKCVALEEINIRNFTALTTLNIKDLKNLNKFYADGSGIVTFEPAAGCKFSALQLPLSLQNLILNNITINNTTYVPNQNLKNVILNNVEGINTYDFITNWVRSYGESSIASLSLEATNINWVNADVNLLIKLAEMNALHLTGYVKFDSVNKEQIDQLAALYGDNVWTGDGELVFDGPAGIFVYGPATLTETESAKYKYISFPSAERREVEFLLTVNGGVLPFKTDSKGRYTEYANVKLYTDGSLETSATGVDVSVTVRGRYRSDISVYSEQVVFVKAYTYPSVITISGDTTLVEPGNKTYVITYTPADFTGVIDHVEWSLEGEPEFVEITASSAEDCIITVKSIPFDVDKNYVLRVKTVFKLGTVVEKSLDITLLTYTYPQIVTISGRSKVHSTDPLEYTISYTPDQWTGVITAVNWSLEANEYMHIYSSDDIKCMIEFTKMPIDDIPHTYNLSAEAVFANGKSISDSFAITLYKDVPVITRESNPIIMKYCYEAGWCADPTKMYMDECAAVTSFSSDTFRRGTGTGNEEYIPESFDEFQYFVNVTSIPASGFHYDSSKFKSIILPPNLIKIGSSAFQGCFGLMEITIPKNVTSIGGSAFYLNHQLKTVNILGNLTEIGSEAFYNCGALTKLDLSKTSLKTLSDRCFYNTYHVGTYKTMVLLPESLTRIGRNALVNPNIKDMYIYAPTAPDTDPNAFTDGQYTIGSAHDSSGHNLYIPSNATGYDDGAWSYIANNWQINSTL